MTRRTERVSELLRGEIAQVLRRDAQDPRLALVTLTRVDLAPDFSNAAVFWSTLDRKHEVEDIQQALESAASFLRARIARVVQLKRVPELRFRHDPSLEKGSATLSLLREIADDETE
jgi:ribosome-binding factor A